MKYIVHLLGFFHVVLNITPSVESLVILSDLALSRLAKLQRLWAGLKVR